MHVLGRTIKRRDEKNELNQNSPRSKTAKMVRKNKKRMEDWKGKDLTFIPVQRQNFLSRRPERLITWVY